MAEPRDPAQEQLHFESMFDEETLNEPLHESDADHIGELLMDLQSDTRLVFTRARRQYNGDTWISNELWNILSVIDHVWDRFQALYDSDAFTRK